MFPFIFSTKYFSACIYEQKCSLILCRRADVLGGPSIEERKGGRELGFLSALSSCRQWSQALRHSAALHTNGQRVPAHAHTTAEKRQGMIYMQQYLLQFSMLEVPFLCLLLDQEHTICICWPTLYTNQGSFLHPLKFLSKSSRILMAI